MKTTRNKYYSVTMRILKVLARAKADGRIVSSREINEAVGISKHVSQELSYLYTKGLVDKDGCSINHNFYITDKGLEYFHKHLKNIPSSELARSIMEVCINE